MIRPINDLKELQLYDGIRYEPFNSDNKYYSAMNGSGFIPKFEINADVILEQSITDKNTWIVVKLFDEMRNDIKTALQGEKL